MSGLHGEECVCDDCMVLDEEQDMKKALVGHIRALEARVAELEGMPREILECLLDDAATATESREAVLRIVRAALATKPGGVA